MGFEDERDYFDEDSRPIPATQFDYPTEADTDVLGQDPVDDATARLHRIEGMSRLIHFLRYRTSGPDQAGRAIWLLDSLVNPQGTQAELAELLGVSPGRICQQLKELKPALPTLASDYDSQE